MAASHKRRSNGEGSVYTDASGRLRGAITLPHPITGKPTRHYVSGRSKAEVVRRFEELKRSGGFGSGETGTEYLTRWLEADRQRVRASTWRAHEQIVRCYIVPAIGSVRLPRLTPLDVERMTAGLIADGKSARTASHARMVLRRALADALRDGAVGRNVAALARPPRVEQREMAYLDREQLRTLLDSLGDHPLGPLVTLAATTGLRQGELLGLAWADVDLDAARLTVRRQLGRAWAADGSLGYALVPTKTQKSRRTISLPTRAVEALRRQRIRQAEARLAAGTAWQDGDGLCFTDSVGRALRGDDTNASFHRLLFRAGLPAVPFHALRHSAASALLGAGLSLKAVSDQLGHSTIVLTANTYGHLTPDAREEAARAMDRALGAEA